MMSHMIIQSNAECSISKYFMITKAQTNLPERKKANRAVLRYRLIRSTVNRVASTKMLVVVATNNQSIIEDKFRKLPNSSDGAKRISNSVASFVAKDLRPYAVVDNTGFRAMMRTLKQVQSTDNDLEMVRGVRVSKKMVDKNGGG